MPQKFPALLAPGFHQKLRAGRPTTRFPHIVSTALFSAWGLDSHRLLKTIPNRRVVIKGPLYQKRGCLSYLTYEIGAHEAETMFINSRLTWTRVRHTR